MSAERTYPLPRPDDDPRFSFGLTYDVARVIEEAGYPKITGSDFVELQLALFKFLYAPATPETLEEAE